MTAIQDLSEAQFLKLNAQLAAEVEKVTCMLSHFQEENVNLREGYEIVRTELLVSRNENAKLNAEVLKLRSQLKDKKRPPMLASLDRVASAESIDNSTTQSADSSAFFSSTLASCPVVVPATVQVTAASPVSPRLTIDWSLPTPMNRLRIIELGTMLLEESSCVESLVDEDDTPSLEPTHLCEESVMSPMRRDNIEFMLSPKHLREPQVSAPDTEESDSQGLSLTSSEVASDGGSVADLEDRDNLCADRFNAGISLLNVRAARTAQMFSEIDESEICE
eukprot:Rhum_TRINITY_DN18586_c0_g1::Rhum_TRINITY_DN18586_c0_g1_i1::g.167727::m.167727